MYSIYTSMYIHISLYVFVYFLELNWYSIDGGRKGIFQSIFGNVWFSAWSIWTSDSRVKDSMKHSYSCMYIYIGRMWVKLFLKTGDSKFIVVQFFLKKICCSTRKQYPYRMEQWIWKGSGLDTLANRFSGGVAFWDFFFSSFDSF